MVPDLSSDEIEKAAHAMTLKYGFLGLPQGGGKAGVFGDPEAPPGHRAATLSRFARAARVLLRERRYVPDADMGTTGFEIQQMLKSIGLSVARREYRGNHSGDYTAATVFASARAAAALQGLEWRRCRVVIEGFGKVGTPLARLSVQAGARVVAVSTRHGGLYQPEGLDIGKLIDVIQLSPRRGLDLYRQAVPGASALPLHELKALPADVFCPCARHDSVRLEDVSRLPAAVISCGANSPITPEAEHALWARGVLCVPDFVANCGGVLGGTMEFAGWRHAEILAFCEEVFGGRVRELLERGRRLARPVRDVAEQQALRRFTAVKRAAERGSWFGGLSRAGLEAYRHGLIPERLMRRLSAGYFRRAAAGTPD
jgi:glutamate dehydrogenase/leucine dehydrogenase